VHRTLPAILLATALTGCAGSGGSGQPPGACPDFTLALNNLTLINPAANAINVPDNQTGMTVEGLIPDSNATVTLTPSNGGPPITATTNPLFPIPQPGPTQYNLVLPALAAHTTYSVTVTSSHLDTGCPITSDGSPGSFTTV